MLAKQGRPRTIALNLRLDAGNVFAVGKVDVRSIDTDVQCLENNLVGLELCEQISVVEGRDLGDFGKVVANSNCLNFSERPALLTP